MIKNSPEHDFILLLNGQYTKTIESIYKDYENLLPRDNIKLWSGPAPVEEIFAETTWRRKSSELMREAYILSLKPDFVLVTTLFEGYTNNVVVSIGLLDNLNNYSVKTGCMFYDAIPLMNPELYLPNESARNWYETKMQHARRSDLLLAISESARREAIDYFKIDPNNVVNISTATESDFGPIKISREQESDTRKKFSLSREFLMYSGATDERKNHLRLIKAYAMIPGSLRAKHQLTFVGRIPEQHRLSFLDQARKCGLREDELVITGGVTDEEMILLYNLCKAFIFPSWHEGFGLPALEAMMCGKAVIASNTSSLPEVVGSPEALFDPFDEESICLKIVKVLRDDRFRANLEEKGLLKSKEFSWELTASRAIKAIESTQISESGTKKEPASRKTVDVLVSQIANISDSPGKSDLITASHLIEKNHQLS